MNIAVIGGGPSGLYLAILAKRREQAGRIIGCQYQMLPIVAGHGDPTHSI